MKYILYYLFLIIIVIIYIIYNNKKCNYNYNYDIYKINFNIPKSLHSYNCCISKENNEYILYTRIDNFISGDDFSFNKIIKYINLFLYKDLFKKENRITYLGITRLNYNFEENNLYKTQFIKFDDIIEDLRVFYYKNFKFFIGTLVEDMDKFCPIVLNDKFNLINIFDENEEKLYGNKNLIPLILNSSLYLIKNHNPLEILKVSYIDNEILKVIPYYKGNYNKKIKKIRGNTLYIPFEKNKLIGITHSCDLFRNYTHYFTILNIEDINNPYIEFISKPICFLGNCGIEFVMGIQESFDNKKYIISLGKDDNKSYLISIEKSYVIQNYLNTQETGL
jgi:hypothetical protein